MHHANGSKVPTNHPTEVFSGAPLPKLSPSRLHLHLAVPGNSDFEPVSIAVNPVETHLTERLYRYQELVELKRILRYGTSEPDGRRILPFRFPTPHGNDLVAEASGLEGFLFTERKYSQQFGTEASANLLPHYIHYTLNLLNGAARTQPLLDRIHQIERSHQTIEERYRQFIDLVHTQVDEWRGQVRALDPSHWSHWARMYHIFLRPFSLADWRAAHGVQHDNTTHHRAGECAFTQFAPPDFARLRDLSLNSIRWMGTFPIGEEGAKGTAGGSPFAIKRFQIDPTISTDAEALHQVSRSADQGIRTIFELVLNHTAIDSDLVHFNPRLFVHTRAKPHDPENYYHLTSPQHGEYWIRYGGHLDEGSGRRMYFTDTLQLDLTNPDTRDLLIAQTKDLVRRYGVQGFRVDMAYKLRNQAFRECWGTQVKHSDPGQREFLEELITAVKVAFPGVAFIAEAFNGWDELSEDGFDLIYGLQDMQLRGGKIHFGWHEALLSRSPHRIRQAIQRAEFLHWQEGGADTLVFWGQHDKPAFWHLFDEQWKWGAALLTLMRPGALSVLAGTEALFEAPCTEDHKVITFNEPITFDWSGTRSDFGQFQVRTLQQYAHLERSWGKLTFELIPAPADEHWIGYLIRPVACSAQHPKVLVLVNPSPQPTSVTIENQALGVTGFRLHLQECGPQGNEVIYLP